MRPTSIMGTEMFKRLMSIVGAMFLGFLFSQAWAADSCLDTVNLFKKAGQSG